MFHKIPDMVQLDIARQARQLKGQLQVGNEVPIGNDLPMLLLQLNIILLEYPILRAGSDSFSALFWRTQAEGKPLHFLGVNSCDYYDRQLFAIAHELYHFLNQGVPHISRDSIDQPPEEQRADWFAAEFLLPLQILKEKVLFAFGKNDISSFPLSKLLRFVAQLQCTWWLPYQSIIYRLAEADAINEVTFKKLFEIDARNTDGLYYRIGLATSKENFKLLNTVTMRTGTDGENLEVVLRNYEDGIISEEELYEGLSLFGVSPGDFGISFMPDETEDEETGGTGDEG